MVTIDSSFPKKVKQNTLAFFESFSQSAIFREGSNRLPWSMKWTDSTERTPTAKVCIQDPILRARSMSPLMVKYQSHTRLRSDLKWQPIEVESGPLVVPFRQVLHEDSPIKDRQTALFPTFRTVSSRNVDRDVTKFPAMTAIIHLIRRRKAHSTFSCHQVIRLDRLIMRLRPVTGKHCEKDIPAFELPKNIIISVASSPNTTASDRRHHVQCHRAVKRREL